VLGTSYSLWGFPIRNFGGSSDGFVAKLHGDGVMEWNTFLGGSGAEDARGIALDPQGRLFVTGSSTATWGKPLAPPVNSNDVMLAAVSTNGALMWNTFIGGLGSDYGDAVAYDGKLVYLTGGTNMGWGSANAYGYDAFISEVDPNYYSFVPTARK